MRILLTNDDGIRAPGLLALHGAIQSLGETEVVAPETVQSATGHGITVATPLLTQRVRVGDAFEGIAVDGRPADCVKLAITHLVKPPVDLVISGMNAGANVGIAVIYSGTVAAAIEAAFMGLPSIAVSLFLKGPNEPNFERAAGFARMAIDLVLAHGIKRGQVVNINIPALGDNEQPAGIKLARQCTRCWHDTYEHRKDPRGQDYFWNNTVFTLGQNNDDTDVSALRNGYITVTPLQFDMTSHKLMQEWSTRPWQI